MPLSPSVAKRIVRAVSTDPNCHERITSVFSIMLPPETGLAGQARNLAFAGWLKILGVTDRYVCKGIAEAAVAVINAANVTGTALAWEEPDTREGNNKHWGVAVEMIVPKGKPRSIYVFDWWLTLDASEPLIFRLADWKAGRYNLGRFASGFQGYS